MLHTKFEDVTYENLSHALYFMKASYGANVHPALMPITFQS